MAISTEKLVALDELLREQYPNLSGLSVQGDGSITPQFNGEISKTDLKAILALLKTKSVEENYVEERLREYPPLQDLIVALVEHVVEGRSESLDKIKIKREEVKAKYPKP